MALEPWTLHLAGGGRLEVRRPFVMAILNATPDSFSDGGALAYEGAVEARVRAALAEGADILDVGGESTRPGHAPVPAEEELARVVPVIKAIRRIDPAVPVSIDTRKAEVARAALDAGASFVNDVSGLADSNMADVVRDAACSYVAMRDAPLKGDGVTACRAQLEDILARCEAGGIPAANVVVDPGLGFGDPPGSDAAANLALIEGIEAYAHGRPVLIGASRKRFVGALAGIEDPARRGEASALVARRAVDRGAAIVRVHDVALTVEALARRG